MLVPAKGKFGGNFNKNSANYFSNLTFAPNYI